MRTLMLRVDGSASVFGIPGLKVIVPVSPHDNVPLSGGTASACAPPPGAS
jgi:hypothetical protein